jgi:signal transduction histidine kinase
MCRLDWRVEAKRDRSLGDRGDEPSAQSAPRDEPSAQSAREHVFELRPPELDREGLVPALQARLDQLRDEHGLDCAFDDDLQRDPEAETKTIAYRIVQEALTNTRKHAGATRVVIALETRGVGLFGSVRDDGQGFSPEQLAARKKLGHLGVVAMRERTEVAGGWLRIESTPDEGTRVEFWIPDAPASADESKDEEAA